MIIVPLKLMLCPRIKTYANLVEVSNNKVVYNLKGN
jgi:hypothetical protein